MELTPKGIAASALGYLYKLGTKVKQLRPLGKTTSTSATKLKAGKWGKSMLALDALSIAEGAWSLASHDFAELEAHEIVLDVLFIGLGVHGVKSHHKKYSTFGAASARAASVGSNMTKSASLASTSILAAAVKAGTHLHKAVPSAIKAGAFDTLMSVRAIGNKWSLRFMNGKGGRSITRAFEVVKEGIVVNGRLLKVDAQTMKKVGIPSLIALGAALTAISVMDGDEFSENKDIVSQLQRFLEAAETQLSIACDALFAYERNPYSLVTELEHDGFSPVAARIEAFSQRSKLEQHVGDLATVAQSYVALMLDSESEETHTAVANIKDGLVKSAIADTGIYSSMHSAAPSTSSGDSGGFALPML